jgi:hypothetical protein
MFTLLNLMKMGAKQQFAHGKEVQGSRWHVGLGLAQYVLLAIYWVLDRIN